MTRWHTVDEVEEEEDSLPRILSMRRKIALGGIAYILCLGLILLASSPGIVTSYNQLLGIEDKQVMDAPDDSSEGDPQTSTLVGGKILGPEYFSVEEVVQHLPYNSSETILFDDFLEDQHAWSWRQQKFTIRDGYMFLNISADRSGDACSAIRDQYLKYAGFEARLRTSSPQVPMMAFGFGGGEAGVQFMWFSNLSSEAARGLHAFCEIQNLNAFWEPIEIDEITEWHTYTVIWEPCNATFIIDGEKVATTDRVPNTIQEAWLYIMNNIFSEEEFPIGSPASCNNLPDTRIIEDQYLQIDYVRIFEVKGG